MEIDLIFPDTEVQNLQDACDKANGCLATLENEAFICTDEGITFNLELPKFITCLASTPHCMAIDEVSVIENVWAALGLDCHERGSIDISPSSSSSSGNTRTSSPYSSTYSGGRDSSTSTGSPQVTTGTLVAGYAFGFGILVAGALVAALLVGKFGNRNDVQTQSYEMAVTATPGSESIRGFV